MKSLGELIYTPEKISGEVAIKAESHVPKIKGPDKIKSEEPFELEINVGPHPNTVQHSIRWIDVYFYEENRSFNPVHIARIILTPEYSEPNVVLTLKLKKSGTIHVLGYCNLHGLWESKKRIEVE